MEEFAPQHSDKAQPVTYLCRITVNLLDLRFHSPGYLENNLRPSFLFYCLLLSEVQKKILGFEWCLKWRQASGSPSILIAVEMLSVHALILH